MKGFQAFFIHLAMALTGFEPPVFPLDSFRTKLRNYVVMLNYMKELGLV